MTPQQIRGWLQNTGHDVSWLLRSWRALARRCGWKCRVICEQDGRPIVGLAKGSGGVYFSAGVHGDEAAAPLALLAWAENHPEALAALSGVIFPCLNPWGLSQNSRWSATGEDLNRCWHQEDHALVGPLRRFLGAREFACALLLHEDYEASGIYLYEPWKGGRRAPLPPWGGELLARAAKFLPLDSRRRIDGRRVTQPAHFFRGVTPKTFAQMGWPEAIYLLFRHTRRSLTFETPSEGDLAKRVAAQVAVIQATLDLARGAGLLSGSK